MFPTKHLGLIVRKGEKEQLNNIQNFREETVMQTVNWGLNILQTLQGQTFLFPSFHPAYILPPLCSFCFFYFDPLRIKREASHIYKSSRKDVRNHSFCPQFFSLFVCASVFWDSWQVALVWTSIFPHQSLHMYILIIPAYYVQGLRGLEPPITRLTHMHKQSGLHSHIHTFVQFGDPVNLTSMSVDGWSKLKPVAANAPPAEFPLPGNAVIAHVWYYTCTRMLMKIIWTKFYKGVIQSVG